MEQQVQTNKKTVLSATVQADVHSRVTELADEREWSIAQTGAYLIRLGLEKLDEMKGAQESKAAQKAA